jgi:multiple sugar transport system ATP-binding protein
MADVVLKGVSKRFKDTVAVDDLELSIADGEFVVLLGPTGVGKTTTLRLIAGLERVDAGQILIGGQDATRAEPSQRDTSFVFQQYSLYPHLTVFDNLAFPLRSPLRRLPEAEIKTRVTDIAKMLRIDDKLGNPATRLSGGQMQRVAIGRALVRRPNIYLMDEPLSSLDAKLRSELRLELKRIQHELGATILYVTHDQIEAMTMADRIVVMHDGIVEQVGTPLELYDHPSNLFVAGFIGSPAMNFIEGTLRRDGGAPVLEAKGGRLALPASTPGADGQKVTLGIRPEHLSISATGPASLDAVVEVVEPTGADTHVVAIAFGQQVQAVFTERHAFAPGARVALCPRAEAIHLFDTASGRHL